MSCLYYDDGGETVTKVVIHNYNIELLEQYAESEIMKKIFIKIKMVLVIMLHIYFLQKILKSHQYTLQFQKNNY